MSCLPCLCHSSVSFEALLDVVVINTDDKDAHRKRGLRDSLARRWQCALVLVMLALATVDWTLILSNDILGLFSLSENPPPGIAHLMTALNLTVIWLSQFNVRAALHYALDSFAK